MHTDAALWHEVMERLADSAITFIDAQLRARRPGVPAVRLVGRCAVGRRLRPLRAARTRAAVFAELAERHPDVRRHPLRHRLRPPARVRCYSGRAERDRARLAHADPRRPRDGSAPTSSCRATSTRRSCSPAPTPRSTAPTRCWPTTAATRATSSTSATACNPTPIPACSSAVVELVHATDDVATTPR